MNSELLLIGGLKLVFGTLVGIIGIGLGSRLVARLLGIQDAAKELADGNHAVGIVMGGSILSMGLLMQHSIVSTFAAVDLITRSTAGEEFGVGQLLLYGVGLLGMSLILTGLIIMFGVRLFMWLTRGIDELGQVRDGNIAPALVMGMVMVVLALMASPGLSTLLDGLLPLPTLGRDIVIETS